MKKALKISAICVVLLWAIFAACLVVIISLGYRFSAVNAVHSFWQSQTHIHTDEYDFWLNDTFDEDGNVIYGYGHTAVKKHGFLYKEVKEKDQKYLVGDFGNHVGSITVYHGKLTNYYFIHWSQSITDIVDEKYVQSMRYFSDSITINGEKQKLYLHCYFEYAGEIEELVVKDEKIALVNEYEKPSVATYAPKPDDTSLEFWITQDVENVDFSKHDEIYGWMGAREYLGKDYKTVTDENGNRVKPKHCVSYIVTAYPDYADGGEFVTQIEITDPKVSIYGLNTNSPLEEFDAVFRKMGYIISIRTYESGAISFTAEKFGNVTFSLYDGGDDGVPMISVRVKVSNRDGIQF